MASLTAAGSHMMQSDFGDTATWEKMLNAFQMLLCRWVWLKQDKHWSRNDVASMLKTESSVAVLVASLPQLRPRSDGNGWKLTKAHEQKHIPFDIMRFGCHQNVHSGQLECSHIHLCKQPAARTQKHRDSLEWQTANRLSEKQLINRAHHRVMCMAEPDPSQSSVPCCTHFSSKSTILFSSIDSNRRNIQAVLNWHKKCNQHLKLPMQSLVCAQILNDFLLSPDVEFPVEIPVHTECK